MLPLGNWDEEFSLLPWLSCRSGKPNLCHAKSTILIDRLSQNCSSTSPNKDTDNLINLLKGPGLWSIALSVVCYSVNVDCKCNCAWNEQTQVWISEQVFLFLFVLLDWCKEHLHHNVTWDFTEHERSLQNVVLLVWPVTNYNAEELCTHEAERLTRLLVRINPKLLDHNSAIVEHPKFIFWIDQQFHSAALVWKGCTLSQTIHVAKHWTWISLLWKPDVKIYEGSVAYYRGWHSAECHQKFIAAKYSSMHP
jgi:hypothetical protein